MDSTQMRAAIAKRAFEARKSAGLSQEELASKTGMAYRTVRRRENGEADFTTSELLTWAVATNVTFEWLMTGEANEMKATA